MKSYANAIGLLFGMAMLAGCASTKVTEQTPMAAPGLAHPNQIWVYDFVAASSDMPADSSLAGQVGAPSTPPTPEEIETGRKYGAMIAQELVKDIQNMGMPAIEAGPGSSPQIGDGVIRGYIVSTEGGGARAMAKRLVIGFGAGTAEMDTVVEGYVMTPQGLRKLGSGTLSSSGNKTPGLVVPAAVAIASANPVGLIVVGGLKIYGAASGRSGLEGRAKSTADEIAAQLKIRFQERGWIARDSVAAAQQPVVNAPRSATARPIAATQPPVQTAATENPAVLAQPPLQITHHGASPIPAGRLYRALKTQFAGGWLGPYQVVSSDAKTKTLVVRRNYIDLDNWSKWAYCKVGPLDMLDNLQDGTVTMTIKLEPARGVTYTSTTADFEGIYGLTSTGKVVPCISRGVLEDNVLATIAAENPPPEPRRLAKHVTIRSRRHHHHQPTHGVG